LPRGTSFRQTRPVQGQMKNILPLMLSYLSPFGC